MDHLHTNHIQTKLISDEAICTFFEAFSKTNQAVRKPNGALTGDIMAG